MLARCRLDPILTPKETTSLPTLGAPYAKPIWKERTMVTRLPAIPTLIRALSRT